jgi:predicted NAD/FAD-binding protein
VILRAGGRKPRVAIVGSGITGLGAAHRLAPSCEVVVFEAANVAGGHAHSVDVSLEGVTHPVDVGFLVFNHRTYPRLLALFDDLKVKTAPSNMSFAVSIGPNELEWCGKDDLRAVFAQPSNLVRPRFWTMLFDMVRFNREATALARAPSDASRDLTLEDLLRQGNYSQALRDDYLLPMAGAIWSCPVETILGFPAVSFARFCDNHGLLQIFDRPQWYTVAGGSRQYVDAILRRVRAQSGQVHLNSRVTRVSRAGNQIWVTAQTKESEAEATPFDAVLMASHAGQSLATLEHPTPAETRILGALRTQPNQAILHTDPALMPRRRRAWGAWNYLTQRGESSHNARPGLPGAASRSRSASVSVSYWLQELQPIPFKQPLFVSLNPLTEPAPSSVLGRFDFAHPVFDLEALAAQESLPTIQGKNGVWFAGAWAGYGFHEDGLKAGQDAADAILAQLQRQDHAVDEALEADEFDRARQVPEALVA